MFASSTAFAGLTKAALVGTWSGQITISLGGQDQSLEISITFGKDGSMTANMAGESGETGHYAVDKAGKTITLMDADKKSQAILTVTKFDGKSLAGTMKATDPNAPADMKVSISLKKSK